MAWRPYENLIEGVLDNTVPGRVTGWMRFLGLKRKVAFDLEGDFHADVRGCVLKLKNPKPENRDVGDGRGNYMKGFATKQKGKAGDITAGIPDPVTGEVPYVDSPYIEWYSDNNGRVVLELDQDQVEVVQPKDWKPREIDERAAARKRSGAMAGFLDGVTKAIGKKAKNGQKPTALVFQGVSAGVKTVKDLKLEATDPQSN